MLKFIVGFGLGIGISMAIADPTYLYKLDGGSMWCSDGPIWPARDNVCYTEDRPFSPYFGSKSGTVEKPK